MKPRPDLPYLSPRSQRWLKLIHVTCSGVWLGSLLTITWLHQLSAGLSDPERRFGVDRALYEVHEVLVFAAFVGTLATGALFSLLTRWGFAQHRWIATKWALASVLFGVTLWAQSPALAGLVALSDVGLDRVGSHVLAHYRTLSSRLALLQLSTLMAIFVISFLKPWGRRKRDLLVRRRRASWVVGGLAVLGTALSVAGYANLRRYRTLPVHAVDLSRAADGTFSGEADCGFVYAVEARVRSSRIDSLKVTANRSAHYAEIAEAVLARILREQSLEVDAITGATTTSRCLMKATEDALRRAVDAVLVPLPATISPSMP